MKEIKDVIKGIEELIQDTKKSISTNYNQDLIETIEIIKEDIKNIETIKKLKEYNRFFEVLHNTSKNYKNIKKSKTSNKQYPISNELKENLLNSSIKLKSRLELETLLENIEKNIIYFGAPGTGKSHKITKIEELSLENNIFRTTFHESYSYSDFLGQYKPRMNGKDIEYSYCEGIFLKALIRALKNKDDYIFLIIEEINRGNCAEIFGDVFQLLDRNENGESIYGISTSEDIKEFLKKSEIENIEKIKIPENLYILATMNTSDQSLFQLDSAFKRRWEMKYVPINYKEIKDISIKYNNIDKLGKLEDTIKRINELILNKTGSEDKQIGQWFINTKGKKEIHYDDIKNKILQYLFFDVFKHDRDEVFSTNQFSELIKNDSLKNCLNEDINNEK